jgi:hypothetical protein
MKDTNIQIDETVVKLLDGKIQIKEAVNSLLTDSGIKVGATVAVLQDPTYPFDGQRGIIRKMHENGFVDVEFPNGATVPLQSSLLVAL